MGILSSKGKDSQPFLEVVAKLNLSCLSANNSLAFADMIMQSRKDPEQDVDLGALPKIIFELLSNTDAENAEQPENFKFFLQQVFEINHDDEEWGGYSITEQLLLYVGNEPTQLYILQQVIASILLSYSLEDQQQMLGLKKYKDKIEKILQDRVKQQLDIGGIEAFKKMVITAPGMLVFVELNQPRLSSYLFACYRYAQEIYANQDLEENFRIGLLDAIIEVCIRLSAITDLELTDQGSTILQSVAKNDDFIHAGLIKALVSQGAIFDAIDITGKTVFALFLEHGNAIGVATIIEYGNPAKLEAEINLAAQNFDVQFLAALLKIIAELELEDTKNLNKTKARLKLAVQQLTTSLQTNLEEAPKFKFILDSLYNASSVFESMLFVETLAFMRTHYRTEEYEKIAEVLKLNDYWSSPFNIFAESLALFSTVKSAVTEKVQQAALSAQPMIEKLRS